MAQARLRSLATPKISAFFPSNGFSNELDMGFPLLESIDNSAALVQGFKGVWVKVKGSWSLFFDFFIFLLLGLWLSGGISIGDHLYLRHGADPRRAALLLGVVGYFFSPQ